MSNADQVGNSAELAAGEATGFSTACRRHLLGLLLGAGVVVERRHMSTMPAQARSGAGVTMSQSEGGRASIRVRDVRWRPAANGRVPHAQLLQPWLRQRRHRLDVAHDARHDASQLRRQCSRQVSRAAHALL